MTQRLSVGDVAPGFTLPDTSGGEVTLDPSAAAATVVVFTANGCPYALAWHDRIQQVARDYAGRDVTVIQIVGNDETGHPEDSVESMRRRVDNGETPAVAASCNHKFIGNLAPRKSAADLQRALASWLPRSPAQKCQPPPLSSPLRPA